jgi:hypothetical protein
MILELPSILRASANLATADTLSYRYSQLQIL